MLTIILMLLVIIIPGWLDARLNWQQAGRPKQEERS